MSLLANMQATASRLLTKYGESVTFSRETGGTFDPVTGAATGTSTTTFSGYAHPSPYTASEIDGTVIQNGDIRLLVEKVTSEPQPGDVVTFREEDYRVMNSESLAAQGGDAAYYVQIRK